MKILNMCGKYIKRYQSKFVIYIILTILLNILTYTSPIITGNFIDGLIGKFNLSFVYKYCIALISITVAGMVLNYMLSILYAKLQSRMGYEFNRDVLVHVQDLPISYLKTKDMSYLNQMINEDTNQLCIFTINLFRDFMLKVIFLPILITVCFLINKEIAITFIFIFACYIIGYKLLKNSLFKFNFEQKENQNKFFSIMFEQLYYIHFIKINSSEDYLRKKMDNAYNVFYKIIIRNQKLEFLFSSIDSFISVIAQIILYILGAVQIMHGNFTIGKFTIYISYFNIILSIIRFLFNYGQDYQDTMVSYKRIQDIMDIKAEEQGNLSITEIKNIHLDNLNFRYLENDYAIMNLSYHFETGYMYAIAGKNGGGKTTLINLLLGLYNSDITNNQILYNGIDIKNINMKDVRKSLIGITEQEPVLMNGSVKDNMFLNAFDDGNLDNLIDVFNLQHINFTTNIDLLTNVSNTISGGEKQKISIIRTLLKDTDLLIFDEPTSAMDDKSKIKFINYLEKIKNNKIIIIVTHDTFIKGKCDKIIELSA